MSRYWILDGHTPVEADLDVWGKWMGKANRHVGDTRTKNHRVSTVFLGVDHNFLGKGKPILFETLVFPMCDEMLRYSTWDEAAAGHAVTVERIMKEEIS